MPDRRTIEPCSIVPAQALRTFGRVDYGRSEEGLLACDLRITMADGGVAMLTVRLDAQPVTAAEIRLHDLVAEPQRGGITRIRPRYENTRDVEQCVHQLQLADGTAVAVEAGAPSNIATDDFCMIGKAGLAAALTTVLQGGFTRHGFRAGTLASTPDFCGLVPADAPGLVPPLAAAKLEARAGGIDCIWKGTDVYVEWTVAAIAPADALTTGRTPGVDLVTIDGRRTAIAGRPGRCIATTLGKPLGMTGLGRRPLNEQAAIVVGGPFPSNSLCDFARAVAAKVWRRIPR